MSTNVNVTRQAIHDKFEAQLKTAQAKLDALKAKAETSKATVETKTIAALQPKKQAIEQKLRELKSSGGELWEKARADVEARIADFEKTVNAVELSKKQSV